MKEIPLTKGLVALVDDADFAELSKHKWHAAGTSGKERAARRVYPDNVILSMYHQLLGKPPKGKVIDHINGNQLDNRRANLRCVTQLENSLNTPRHKNRVGISFDATHSKWKAYIDRPRCTRINVGTYKTRAEAETALAARLSCG